MLPVLKGTDGFRDLLRPTVVADKAECPFSAYLATRAGLSKCKVLAASAGTC